MSDTFKNILPISVLFLLFGIIFITAGLLIMYNQKKKKKKCVFTTIGKVINLVETGNDANFRFYLHPVFEYTVNGETIIKQSSFGTKEKHYFIGQQIEVHYNPFNYHDYFVTEEDIVIKTTTKIFLVLGGLFSFFGILFLIFALIIK